MIALVVGTTAELIKVAPVMRALRARGLPVEVWYTGMHMTPVPTMLESLGLEPPAVWLARGSRGRDVTEARRVPGWAATVVSGALRRRRRLRARLAVDGPGLILVHGDTFSTVLGGLLARALRVPLGHIEAGLRSGSLRSPFPEEINRRVVGRLADVHFAPTPREEANLWRACGRVLCTGGNTVVDVLQDALESEEQLPDWVPPRYGLVTLHRFELVRRRDEYRAVLQELVASSQRVPLLLLLGASDTRRLSELDLVDRLPGSVIVAPKLPYQQFVHLVANAEFVVTDSGGLQEECAYLGTPCLVHRSRTERFQGVGDNVVLSGLRLEAVRQFLANPAAHRRPREDGAARPSELIAQAVEALLERPTPGRAGGGSWRCRWGWSRR